MSNSRPRIAYAPVWVVAGFAAAGLSQLRVQAFARQDVIDAGTESKRFVVERDDHAKRGEILSSDGKALATVEDESQLGLFFDQVPNSPAFFMDLGAASGIPASEMMQLRASGQKKSFWQERLSPARTAAVRRVREDWRADGVSLNRAGARSYPLGEAAACLIGHMKQGEPLGGIEKAYDAQLRGRDGTTIGMVDRRGEFLPLRLDPQSTRKQDGMSLKLTIDSEIQIVASESVKRAVEENNAHQGCAIVLDPKTGDILAMANWPSFDPERIGEPTKSRVGFSDTNPNYMARLEPGSTFKILTLALAIDAKRVDFGERLTCTGSKVVWGRSTAIRCDQHGGSRAHGVIGPLDAIAKSCNVSAATWAQRVGYERFTDYLDTSELVSKPGLGLPLETKGSYNRNEYAKGLQLATFGFGQSLTVTPLGLCSAFSMLGNRGVQMAPRLVASIGDREQPRREIGQMVEPETAGLVMEAMEAVFTSAHGTGKGLRIPGYRLAGKTGTAQKINKDTGTVVGGGYVSNFVGFVPAEAPRATILVMIDDPKSGRYYGGTVAGPVFQDIAKAVIRRFGIPKSAPAMSNNAQELSVADSRPAYGPQMAPAPGLTSGPEIAITARPANRSQVSRRR